MTIAQQGNSQGGVLIANGTPAANLTSFSGLPFCKNKLFNGEVTRINQRGFDGNWATKNIWASGNTIAQQELCYGYDMWAKASATDMLQVIEAGNFRPSTVHTLSGIGVTTQQITSPASGNWVITVPQTARNVQVEEGVEATPFEIRPYGFELAQCQRYYELMKFGGIAPSGCSFVATIHTVTSGPICSIPYGQPKRVIPSVKDTGLMQRYVSNIGVFNAGTPSIITPFENRFTILVNTTPGVSFGWIDNLGDIFISAVI